MALSPVAAFAQGPQFFGAILTAAGAANGSDATLLFTAGENGALISRMSVCPQGTVTASGVTVYIEKAGSTVRLAKYSVLVPAFTYGATARLPVANVAVELAEATPLRLGPGDKIYATSFVANAAGIAVSGDGANF